MNNRKKSFIHCFLTDKSILFELDLIRRVPASLFSSDLHIEVCLKIAQKTYHQLKKEKYLKVYTNLLVRKSTTTKALTALFFLIKKGSITPVKIVLPSQLLTIFSTNLKKFQTCIGSQVLNKYVDMPSKKILIAKYLYHKIYRLIGWKFLFGIKRSNNIVRSYVEVSEKIHGTKRMQSSLCMFFPFPYKLTRQLRFVRHCKQKGWDIIFYGLPYSLHLIIRIIFFRKDHDITKLELNAYNKQGQEFILRGVVGNYYTEDDYDAASFILNEQLRHHGCKVINAAHGVNQTCPFISCSVFEVMTKPQLEFYKKWNRGAKIEYLSQKYVCPLPYGNFIGDNSPVLFIFMHSNLLDSGIYYEGQLQEKIIRSLEELCQIYDIRIKYHPNTRLYPATTLKSISHEEIDQDKCIKVFITINSTAFYTYSKYGVFFFIGDELCNPFNIINKNIPFYHLQSINTALEIYSEKNFLIQAQRNQLNLLKD